MRHVAEQRDQPLRHGEEQPLARRAPAQVVQDGIQGEAVARAPIRAQPGNLGALSGARPVLPGMRRPLARLHRLDRHGSSLRSRARRSLPSGRGTATGEWPAAPPDRNAHAVGLRPGASGRRLLPAPPPHPDSAAAAIEDRLVFFGASVRRVDDPPPTRGQERAQQQGVLALAERHPLTLAHHAPARHPPDAAHRRCTAHQAAHGRMFRNQRPIRSPEK